MPVTMAQIEKLTEEAGLDFDRANETTIIVPFEQSPVYIELHDEGELVLFRGTIIFDMHMLSHSRQRQVLQHFMELNSDIKYGRFVGFPIVTFQVPLPIKDGELTAEMFYQCVSIVAFATEDSRSQPKFAPEPPQET